MLTLSFLYLELAYHFKINNREWEILGYSETVNLKTFLKSSYFEKLKF